MAEGEHLPLTVFSTSEELFEYNCSPCEDVGLYKEAHRYCHSCKLYYCKKCLGDHNKFPVLRDHLIRDVEAQPKITVPAVSPSKCIPAPSNEPCGYHPEKVIEMFCDEHDVVCCTVCIALDHRKCHDVNYILDLAKDIRKRPEYIDYMNEVTRIKTVYEEAMQSIQDEIQRMGGVKAEIIREINEYTQELISRIEELESNSIKDVNSRYKEITEQMNTTASYIDESLDKVSQLKQDIDILSESQVFVTMQRRVVEGEDYMISNEMLNIQGLSYSIDENIRNGLDNVDGLFTANFPVNIPLKEVYGTVSVDDDDETDFSVHDMIILDDDTIVMTCKNMLKRFHGASGLMMDSISVQGKSWGICKTSRSNQMALTIYDMQTIQIVKYTKTTMSLTKSFTVGASCKGICCRDGHLYVACGSGDLDNNSHIRKYNTKGKLFCIIDADTTGRRIFSSPQNMTIDSNTDNIYIADRDNGIIVLDRKEKITSHLYDSFLRLPRGISLASRNAIFVSGIMSNKIQQYDENCRFVGTLLNSSDEIWCPSCILLDIQRKKLLVSLGNHNTVYIYDIEC